MQPTPQMKGNPVQSEEAIFEAALNCATPEARKACLDQACSGQAELRQRVEALLASHEEAGSFLHRPLPVDQPTIKLNLPAEEAPGTLIGRYKILEKIGEGGFGAVYVAEQREPVKRRVALKIIKLGMDTRQVVGRFEAERQALALMDHPNIAKVLDAGATETGRPFFVMELVRGIKITDYCDQHKLPMPERLNLYIHVCHAIQHAHQKGIIHRDIKPSNILVTLHDGVAIPKVIDFGIAKATQGELTDKTVYTQFQQFIGTPAYMSPEQAEMSGLDIDTRSDIYSLGVLLYELLTGRTPFDQKQLLEAGLDGMRKMIREMEPVRPSTRVDCLPGDDRTTTAARRQTEVPRLIHLLRGDLDWIVMKGLEKDRTRRYETANGLAMDIQRYLKHEIVLATPPSKFYRFQKLVRRNQLQFAAATLTALALLLAALVSVRQAVRASQAEVEARQERDAAMRARQQAEAMNHFLTEDLLFQATPDQNAREKQVTVEQVLERAARRLNENTDIAKQPAVEATLRLAIGTTYQQLGAYSAAEEHLRRAVDLRQTTLGPEDPATLAAKKVFATLLLVGLRRVEQSEKLISETWRGLERLLGKDNRETLDCMALYIYVLAQRGKLDEAVRLKQQNLAGYERAFGPDDRDTINELGNLAILLAMRGDYAQAESEVRQALERYRRAGLADNSDAMWNLNNLAAYRFFQGAAHDGETLLIEARPRAVRLFGAEHPITLQIQHLLARVWAETQQLEQAENLAREILSIRRRVLPTDHESLGRTILLLGRIYLQREKFNEAESLLREARNFFRNYYPTKLELIAQAENGLGALQLRRAAYTEAEGLLLPGADQFFARSAEMSPQERRDALAKVIKLHTLQGRADKAALLQSRLDELGPTLNGATAPEPSSTPTRGK